MRGGPIGMGILRGVSIQMLLCLGGGFFDGRGGLGGKTRTSVWIKMAR